MSSGNDGNERTARIARLRDEIRGVIEREYAFAVKYRELAASFETLMPHPDQRHDAALLALSTTMKGAPREVGAAVISQQEELALLEQAVGELFAQLGAKSGGQGNSAAAAARVQQGTAAPVHCPKCGEPLSLDRYEDRWKCRSCSHEVAPGNPSARGQEREKPAAVAAEKAFQKKCPRCGGVMHYHAHDDQWLCYTCSHEEAASENVRAGSGEKAGQTKTPGAASAPSFVEPLADMIAGDPRKTATAGAGTQSRTAGKRVCPVCGKKMDWHEHEKRWRCFFCNHKMRG